jgi:general secretion pathway protein I
MTLESDQRIALSPALPRGARRIRPAHRQSGFTLIEVLAALIIVSLGMLGVIEAVTQTARNGAYLREKLLAQTIAMNQLTEVRLKLQPPDIDETKGDVEFAGARWRWTMKVTQTAVQSMRRIDISVAPIDAPERTSLASMTGFYGAALAPAGTNSAAWICIDPTKQATQTPPEGNPPATNPPGATPNPQEAPPQVTGEPENPPEPPPTSPEET